MGAEAVLKLSGNAPLQREHTCLHPLTWLQVLMSTPLRRWSRALSKLPDRAALRKLVAASACRGKRQAVSVLDINDLKVPCSPGHGSRHLTLALGHLSVHNVQGV
jgi:hypothetical protein